MGESGERRVPRTIHYSRADNSQKGLNNDPYNEREGGGGGAKGNMDFRDGRSGERNQCANRFARASSQLIKSALLDHGSQASRARSFRAHPSEPNGSRRPSRMYTNVPRSALSRAAQREHCKGGRRRGAYHDLPDVF